MTVENNELRKINVPSPDEVLKYFNEQQTEECKRLLTEIIKFMFDNYVGQPITLNVSGKIDERMRLLIKQKLSIKGWQSSWERINEEQSIDYFQIELEAISKNRPNFMKGK
jgi:hypothetical protein